MNAPDSLFLPDEQSRADLRNLPITRVGVRGIKFPIQVNSDGHVQSTVAEVEMTVFLPAEVKGTHMSRFLEILEAQEAPLDQPSFRVMMTAMLDRLESEQGTVKVKFPYFVRKTAPVSGVTSLLDYEVELKAVANKQGVEYWVTAVVPVTRLCPCSKKIFQYVAHNQRSHITIEALAGPDLSIEGLLRMAEESASCELWGLLKRPDEKYVTERAYENPKFVEDLVRDVALRLNESKDVLAYRVESENFESIHNHSAVAWIEHDKRGQ